MRAQLGRAEIKLERWLNRKRGAGSNETMGEMKDKLSKLEGFLRGVDKGGNKDEILKTRFFCKYITHN